MTLWNHCVEYFVLLLYVFFQNNPIQVLSTGVECISLSFSRIFLSYFRLSPRNQFSPTFDEKMVEEYTVHEVYIHQSSNEISGNSVSYTTLP